MQNPVMTMAGQLMWTRSGTVWATWRLDPQPYGYRPEEDKRGVRTMHQMLLRAHQGEALLIGARAAVEPVDVVQRMIEGVPLEECPEWAAECEAALDLLEQIEMGERTFWLAVPLRNAGVRDKFLEPLRSAARDITDSLAVPRAAIAPAVVSARAAQAAEIEQNLPAAFAPRPATVAEQVWLQWHAQQRGLFTDPALPQPGVGSDLLTPRRGRVIPDVIVDEGGRSDVDDRAELRRLDPRKRRFVKIDNPELDEASYQQLVVLADMPPDGVLFPGSEFLGRVDEAGPFVDWACRLSIRGHDEVVARNRRAVRDMNDQYIQRDGELSSGANELDHAAAALAEYQTVIANDQLEVEVGATSIFAVCAGSAEQAIADAKTFVGHYRRAGYNLTAPLGQQAKLWWAMLPGTPTSPVVRDYEQIATSAGFAASCPLISTSLGDRRGCLLAVNRSASAFLSPVLIDLEGASTRLDISGSVAVTGESGAGKSTVLKALAGAVSDRGGQWVAIDRTDVREWADMARLLPFHTIVDTRDPVWSADPLRLFGPLVGARAAQSFLGPLLNVPPRSSQGVLLSEVLDADYLQRHQVGSLGALIRHLASDCELPGSAELARLMNVFARKDFGRLIFDESLPPLPLDSPAVVFGTHTLELPTEDEMANGHLFDNMRIEKIYGRAVYALIAAVARAICFRDRHQLGVFVVDECAHVTASPEGELELINFVKEGRRHKASVIIASHDPAAEFGNTTLRGLIPTRIVLRQRDEALAIRSIKYLDLEPTPALVHEVRFDMAPVGVDGVPPERRGEGLMRDPFGSIGPIKVLQPARRERAVGTDTTPAQR